MQTVENKNVVRPVRGCQYEPHALCGLWDMISFLADGLFGVFSPVDVLELCQRQAESKIAQFGPGSRLTRDESDLICRQLKRLSPFCDKLNLVVSPSYQLSLEQLVFDGPGELVECSVVAVSIKNLLSAVRSEVNRIQFALIPKNKVKFFEQHDLFGEAVSAAFPSAQPEIKDVGNCLAADLHTAAVFHLMRTAEFGLREMAKTIKAKLPVQIEYATWGQVIDAIQKRLDKLKGKSVAKDKKRQIYSALILDIRAFCHLWRNPVSHLRGRFSEAGALDAFGHVRDFMLKLTEMGVRERN
jgi:hypothetical protein